MKVHLTRQAAADLRTIYRTLAETDRPYAARMIRKLDEHCAALSLFPNRGPVVHLGQTTTLRRIVVDPFLIVYRVVGDVVHIATVLHGARDLEPLLAELDPSEPL